MSQTYVSKTIQGEYNPRNQEQYLSVEKNYVPKLATFLEQLKTYDDNYAGYIFCLKTEDTTQTIVAHGSTHGGMKVPKIGFSRSPGL